MNWSKTIKINDHRRLVFNHYEMKIALLIDGVWCWGKTFTDSKLFDLVNHMCNLLYVGLYNRYAVEFNSKDKLHGQKSMLEFSTLCCLGFEQIIKPDSYSISKDLVFEPNEEIDTFVHLVTDFEVSYEKLARSIIDDYLNFGMRITHDT